MTKVYKPISLDRIKTYPLKKRRSKVDVSKTGRPFEAGGDFKGFLETLPDILAAKDFKTVVSSIVKTYKKKGVVLLGMGAHPIKVGLSPLIIDLMERGIITAIAMNGACIIHDFELTFAGCTSEDVDREISTGSFGMAEETGRMLNRAISEGVAQGMGIGEVVGRMIQNSDFPHKDKSILASAVRLGIPATVHVAIGTDIIHMHPQADGSSIGEGSHRDFRLLCDIVSRLEGGVYINLGSAVVMPEVFLKAVTIVRNLGYRLKRFTTVNMDFIQHYRPLTNVLKRPVTGEGKGYALTGHHEIMFPLLAAAVKEGVKEFFR
ncbi:MAG: hypothetical protein AB1488_02085 [Nitrospirota bacterium]